MHHLVRNLGGAATFAILRPTFGQKEFAVQQAVEIVNGIAQMHRHDAVVFLAGRSAPLVLHARRFLTLLGAAGFIQQANAMRTGVLARHQLLQRGAQPIVIPVQQAEKLLQGPRRHPRRIGDRLAILPRQVRQLPLHISSQMAPRIAPRKAVREPSQVFLQRRPQRLNLSSIHARPLSEKALVCPTTAPISKAS